MAASNRIKAEMYILFSCNAWHEYSSFEPKAVIYPFQLQRMARIQFIRAKGGLLFHRKGSRLPAKGKGSRLPAKEQKKTETGGR